MSLPSLVWLIPLPPLIAFGLIILVTRGWKVLSAALAIGLMGGSFLLAQIVF